MCLLFSYQEDSEDEGSTVSDIYSVNGSTQTDAVPQPQSHVAPTPHFAVSIPDSVVGKKEGAFDVYSCNYSTEALKVFWIVWLLSFIAMAPTADAFILSKSKTVTVVTDDESLLQKQKTIVLSAMRRTAVTVSMMISALDTG